MGSCKHKMCLALSLAMANLGTTTAMATAPVVQGGGASLITPLINAEITLFGTSVGALTYFSVASDSGEKAFLFNQPSFFDPTVGATRSISRTATPPCRPCRSRATTSPPLRPSRRPCSSP
ncbi:hypothetical protein [Burkholderia plantarii]|uniref:hypothetical protein n=1 Tax=Burkholderia plantarii TaxID=41899 RepID=UPI00114D18BF|nr:hypothetical protein [Burkholderia plantarii]